MTTAEETSGLAGLTVTCRRSGSTTRSMSSMGVAPNRTFSPGTGAPAKHDRLPTWER